MVVWGLVDLAVVWWLLLLLLALLALAWLSCRVLLVVHCGRYPVYEC